MMTVDAQGMHFQELSRQIKSTKAKHVTINNCMGQRYIGSGMRGREIHINGTPGNALGAYFDGPSITVMGNAQEATGDTMNDGKIIIHGSSGDATGYAMRGGKIFVRDNTGYRAGIHMKAYEDKVPVLLIGGRAGHFLGEYQAGGRIVVLGLNLEEGRSVVGDFCGTGMHGGAIYLRCEKPPEDLPVQVAVHKAEKADLKEIESDVREFCSIFDLDSDSILADTFFVLRPNMASPYKQLYTQN